MKRNKLFNPEQSGSRFIPNKRPGSRLSYMTNSVDHQQPLVPRICDECYYLLTEAICEANDQGMNMVAAHCPHYMVLIEVELHEGAPLGVVMTGPITQEESNARINESFGFE